MATIIRFWISLESTVFPHSLCPCNYSANKSKLISHWQFDLTRLPLQLSRQFTDLEFKGWGRIKAAWGVILESVFFRIWIRISIGNPMELFSMPCWNGKFSVIPQNDPNECVHFPATYIILQTMNYSNWVTILWMVRKQKPRKNEAKCAMYRTK